MEARNAIPIDDALRRRIDELAETSGMSASDVVREAVEEFAARRNGGETPTGDSDGLFEAAARIADAVPEAEWAKLPSDLAKNFDHYHYGHPRVD